jgi:hypothetical protein
MQLFEIYQRCGLKDPAEFKKEVKTKALFEDALVAKNILEYGRRQGRTTGFIMLGIQNLYKQHNTVIWVPNFSSVRDNHHIFLKYSAFFPDLNIEVEDNGEFSSSHKNGLTRLKFVALHNNVPQTNLLGFRWDTEYDDSY